MQFGTKFEGMYVPRRSVQVKAPVKDAPFVPAVPYGMSYLSEHCIWQWRPYNQVSHTMAPLRGASNGSQGISIYRI